MDVFKLRESVVNEYKAYVESFVRVYDERVDDFVRKQLAAGELWPEAVLQLNPAFVLDRTLGELSADGTILPETARFFGEGLRLYQHQREALSAAQHGDNYVVTTGTGSGKSLTYLVPIYDAIMRDQPELHTVRAIIVYPMNALINSQLDALKDYRDRNFPNSPVRFERYTGQTRNDVRQSIIDDPPHILLTNYVMLEYLLTRPFERTLLNTATHDLRHLVMDELHFYRGRQGADVALLLRRLQGRGQGNVQVIGTSATVASEGDREERRGAVARVATRLFGVEVSPANVIDETLQQMIQVPVPDQGEELRAAVALPAPRAEVDAVTHHPLAAWVEQAFGISTEDGRLVRHRPERFADAVTRLSEGSGEDEDTCSRKLQEVLDAGNYTSLNLNQPVFAFRLHQFLSSGSSVRATLEPIDQRYLTMDGLYKAEDDKVLYPLTFCRECGQDYYLGSIIEEDGVEKFVPRSPMGEVSDEDIDGKIGYFALEDGGLWAGDDDELPEFWFEERRAGRRIRSNYSSHRPKSYVLAPDGTVGLGGARNPAEGWFQPQPLMLCLRCRAPYELRTSDYRKMASLSQTGRSTATTLVVNAMVAGMAEQNVPRKESKVLSFTDNRQDASLQSGHLNDFVQVAQLRAAIVGALQAAQALTFDNLGTAIFNALAPEPRDFLKEPVEPDAPGRGYAEGRRAMIDLLDYRALEDLSRGWRVVQPNLEQAGLLRLGYLGLDDLANDDSLWRDLPAIAGAAPETREGVLRALLDHLRMQLAIDAVPLTEDSTKRLIRNTSQWLRAPWALDERDRLRLQTLALLPGVQPPRNQDYRRLLRLSGRSSAGRYLRSARTWNNTDDLSIDAAETLVIGIVDRLKGHLLEVVSNRGQEIGVRVKAAALLWDRGVGHPAPPDPVRSRALHMRRNLGNNKPNKYFKALYGAQVSRLRGMQAAEHTGQVNVSDRETREHDFREGDLPALFCSPTMELGVDIRDLHAVHLRNLPPTPANYAQRSGRAGRGGRPALIAVFAAQGNAHDQHFFNNRDHMIAGAVAPARIDLRNQELVRAHLHSEWLAIVGLSIGRQMVDILDLTDPALPLLDDHRAHLQGPLQAQAVQAALAVAGKIVDLAPEIKEAWWYSDNWIKETIVNAAERFDQSFNRWRELYRSAVAMRDRATKDVNDATVSRNAQEEAKQREREARREIDLLLNRGNRNEESDFYPYRYLASEGFLPGYNFPRLPVRALVAVKDGMQSIDRYRFLGLSEFGPGQVIYHEGRKHRVDSVVMPSAGIEERLVRAILCKRCGYFHSDNVDGLDICESCGVRLDANNSDRPQRLLDQPVMRTRSVENISSEEEVRRRSGFRITTHFRFAPHAPPRRLQVDAEDGTPLFEVIAAPAAELWRINHGWRRSEGDGFVINPVTGRWQRREMDRSPGEEDDPDAVQLLAGIKPFVSDRRNLLLVKPLSGDNNRAFMITLLHAIKRSVQLRYQVEEQEVEAELIGEGEYRQLMLWEAAEGGTGVWDLMMEQSDAFRNLAGDALALCHCDPETGAGIDGSAGVICAAACYQCLLSYSNQLEHRHIDRGLVRDFLLRLTTSTSTEVDGSRSRDDQFQWLKDRTDPASSLEVPFLEFLYGNGYRLPDAAQNRPAEDVASQPDFYYERGGLPGACVFVDGSDHLAPGRQERDTSAREALEDRGYRVIVIRFDAPLDEQVGQHTDIFGVGCR